MLELRNKLELFESIASSSSTPAHKEKLQAKLKKAEGEAAKARQRYAADVEKASASFARYTEAMRAQLDTTTEDIARRLGVLQGMLAKFMGALHFEQSLGAQVGGEGGGRERESPREERAECMLPETLS